MLDRKSKCFVWLQWSGVLVCVLLCMAAGAQSQKRDSLTILKIDPPNWFATMPKPMLLLQGTGLATATYKLSDPSLRIEKIVPSANGHYVQLWLSASPARPETVTIIARNGREHVDMPYAFVARKPFGGEGNHGFEGFSSRDVVYLIMTDRFADGDRTNDGPTAQDDATSSAAEAERAKPRGWHGGDLRGIAQHLDYLQQLGITAVWTTPVYQNHGDQSYHGYGATDLYAVDEHYGSLGDLKALAAALHARSMKLVLDTVPNHIGPTHPWVRDEPAPDWFHGTLAHHREAETNFSALIDPHAAERDRIGTLDGWFANVLPDMDTESPAVAQYLRQNAVWWIEETGADALRIDTFPYVNREFWHDFNGELKQLYPRLTEVGEVFNGDPDIVSAYADGVTRAGVDTRLFTPFDFPTYFALRDVFAPKVGSKPAPMSKLAEILVADNLYPHPERLVPFLGNHDTTRILTETKSEAAVRLGFAYLLTTRGMPQIYSGDEIAMYGGGDPDDRHDFPGGFITTPTAFSANGRTAVQQRMFAWVSQLTSVRQKHVALGCGGEQVLSANADWLVTLRDGAHAAAGTCAASAERVLVAIHRGMVDNDAVDASLDVKLADTWASGCHLKPPDLATPASTASIAEDTLHLKASGNAVVIAACR